MAKAPKCKGPSAKQQSIASSSGGASAGTLRRSRSREKLLQAADQLFRDVGYDATSTRDIIANSGLALGTFYNYFKDKEDLFRALLQERSGSAIAAQREYRRNATSFPEFISRHFEWFFRDIFEDSTWFELFHRNSAAIRDMMSGPHEVQGFAYLEQDLRYLVETGVIARLDTEFAAAAISGISYEMGAIAARRVGGDPAAAAAFATRLLVDGLPWRKENDM